MKTRTSWSEKLEGAHPAKIVPIPPRMQKRFGQGTMLIPRPLDVDVLIRKIPRGKLLTQSQLREKLARKAGANLTCPLCAGMFLRISAEASAEQARAGKSRVTPYWRVVRDDGRLMENLPGGPTGQAEHLMAEGHRIDTSGKLRVKYL
jgi:hypothetical protein